MTYETFAVKVEQDTGLSRKEIFKTARRLIIEVLCAAIAVGYLISSVFGFSSWMIIIAIFLVLLFSSFSLASESGETFQKAMKIGKFYPLFILLAIVAFFAIKLLV